MFDPNWKIPTASNSDNEDDGDEEKDFEQDDNYENGEADTEEGIQKERENIYEFPK